MYVCTYARVHESLCLVDVLAQGRRDWFAGVRLRRETVMMVIIVAIVAIVVKLGLSISSKAGGKCLLSAIRREIGTILRGELD